MSCARYYTSFPILSHWTYHPSFPQNLFLVAIETWSPSLIRQLHMYTTYNDFFCVAEFLCDWLNFFVFAKICCNTATIERCYCHNRVLYYHKTVPSPSNALNRLARNFRRSLISPDFRVCAEPTNLFCTSNWSGETMSLAPPNAQLIALLNEHLLSSKREQLNKRS